jgi:hypothetical protein
MVTVITVFIKDDCLQNLYGLQYHYEAMLSL